MSIVLPNPPDLPGSGYPDPTPELEIQRRLTAAFIMTQPVNLVLTPRSRVRTSSGGHFWVEGTPRDVQTMRFVEPGQPNLPITGSDGVVRETEFLLIGEWDSIIGRYDLFAVDDKRWEVAELYPCNGWERRAAVLSYG